MPSRKIEDLHDSMRKPLADAMAELKSIGIEILITCTARTYEEQVALYAQGREKIEVTNNLRLKAGLPRITATENKSKVAWTLESKHITGNGRKLSDAFDFCILNKGKATWDIKVDVNGDSVRDYIQAGVIFEKHGFVWGGRWKTPDYPHCQRKGC